MVKKKQNIERKILGKIKSGEIKMKPRWRFVVEMWEQRALWLLFLFGLGLSIMGMWFFAQRYNPKDLFEYGSIGWQVFYEDFPYYWLFGAIIFWMVSIKTWLSLGSNYRMLPKKIFIGSGMGLVILIALVLFLN